MKICINGYDFNLRMTLVYVSIRTVIEFANYRIREKIINFRTATYPKFVIRTQSVWVNIELVFIRRANIV